MVWAPEISPEKRAEKTRENLAKFFAAPGAGFGPQNFSRNFHGGFHPCGLEADLLLGDRTCQTLKVLGWISSSVRVNLV